MVNIRKGVWWRKPPPAGDLFCLVKPHKINNMWYLIIILIFIFAVAIYFKIKDNEYDDYDEAEHDEESDYTFYRKKYYLFSIAEKRFYDILKSFLKDEYLIFDKVRIADLLYYPMKRRSWRAHFNRIQSKHADFVICDKNKISPLLVIELDDSSRNRYDRRKRDNFVDKIFEEAKLPILYVKNYYNNDFNELQNKIFSLLKTARS